jgi:hypothetical protein
MLQGIATSFVVGKGADGRQAKQKGCQSTFKVQHQWRFFH